MYLENEYLKPVEIESYHLKTIKELSEEQIIELSRIYRNLFNVGFNYEIVKLHLSSASIKATPKPIPCPAPVTIAVLF